MVLLSAGIVAGLLLAVSVGSALASPTRTPCTAGLTPKLLQLARKWAGARGLPVEWVLATIQIESGWRSCLVGKAVEIGLMQIYPKPHAATLARMGLTSRDLFNPEINIAVGTAYMRQLWDRIYALTKGRTAVPIGEIVALAYRGPDQTLAALRDGSPLPYPARAARWNAALRKTAALV